MNIEYEASFRNVDKSEMRARLASLNATLVKKEFLQKRLVFNLPKGHEIPGAWLRVRDEQDKTTLSLKIVKNNGTIEDQKEIELKIDNLEAARELLTIIGCEEKAYQESLREKWVLDNVEITIDEWPYLEPFIEIEGKSEVAVKQVAQKMGVDYAQAYFGAVDGLYAEKYGISTDRINNHTPQIVFNMKQNPFT